MRRQHAHAIQNAPFELILYVTNREDRVFPGATIGHITITPGEAGVIKHTIMKEFAIGPLNPGQAKTLHIDTMTTPLEGTVWVECPVTPINTTYEIETYQRDSVTGEIEKYSGPVNTWGKGWFIERRTELLQARTNLLLVILAGLTVLEGVVGLRTITDAILGSIGNALLWLARLFGAGG